MADQAMGLQGWGGLSKAVLGRRRSGTKPPSKANYNHQIGDYAENGARRKQAEPMGDQGFGPEKDSLARLHRVRCARVHFSQ